MTSTEESYRTPRTGIFGRFNMLMVLILFGTAPAFSQISGCEKLKEGKFQIEDKVNGVSIITRSAGIQREENEQMGIIVEYLTEWLDACTFRLVPFKVIKNDNNLNMEGDLKLEIEIVEIREGSYIQITTAWATGQNETEEVKIIK